MLLSRGEATPPCGVPATTLSNTPSTSAPAVSIDLIKLNTLPSATRSATRCYAPLNCGMVMPLSGGIEGRGTKEEVTPGGERLAVKGAGSGGLSLCVAR